LNQIYTFPTEGNLSWFAGVCASAGTYGATGVPNQVTVTRAGAGLMFGVNVNRRWYVEGRYEWYDAKSDEANPEGFRAVLGFRL
jgi:hypothetical protein